MLSNTGARPAQAPAAAGTAWRAWPRRSASSCRWSRRPATARLADLNVLGLALLARALAAGGGAFGRHEALLALLREDAWAALAAAARGGGLAALAGACQAALALYCTLGSAVLLQARAGGRGGPPICL